jgi:hypothetical protein
MNLGGKKGRIAWNAAAELAELPPSRVTIMIVPAERGCRMVEPDADGFLDNCRRISSLRRSYAIYADKTPSFFLGQSVPTVRKPGREFDKDVKIVGTNWPMYAK